MPRYAERLLGHVPEGVLEALDSWKFWVAVAYAGLAGVLLGLYVLFENQSNETARRIAIQRSAAQASVSACVTSVKNAPLSRGFAEAHRALVANQILTTTAALQASPSSDPLYEVRLASLHRLEKAMANADKLIMVVKDTTPTKARCNAIAEGLGLPHPFKQRP